MKLECGAAHFEVPRVLRRSGAHWRPTAHVCQGQAASSWHGTVWMLQSQGARMTLVWDRFHRLHNDVLDGIAEAGLSVMRFEMLKALKPRRGPWGKDQTHAVTQQAAANMFAELDWSDALFDCYFEEVCADLGERGPGVGSAEHMRATWQRCSEMLVEHKEGPRGEAQSVVER